MGGLNPQAPPLVTPLHYTTTPHYTYDCHSRNSRSADWGEWESEHLSTELVQLPNDWTLSNKNYANAVY